MADAYVRFRDDLLQARLLVGTGVDGLYLRSAAFEAIVVGVDRLVSEAASAEELETLHFPLVMARRLLEQTDYIRSFPDLIGTVTSFTAGESAYPALLEMVDAGKEWAELLSPTDVALCSAACHPLYPTCTGVLSDGELRFEIFGQVFRREPSVDPARMQAFRQHEVVYLGDPAGAWAHRDLWVERGLEIHSRLALKVEAVVANDPFFGRSGRMLAANQRTDALKIELVTPICSEEAPTAITSANCHLDHFGVAFDISQPDGSPAHSACVGFGVERIALALLHSHGLDVASWPPSVREALLL